MVWLKFTPARVIDGEALRGPGTRPVRGERRINGILTAVRAFLAFAVVNRDVPGWVLAVIYELADTRDLPIEARGEDVGLSAGCVRSIGCTSRRGRSTGPPMPRSWRCSVRAGQRVIG